MVKFGAICLATGLVCAAGAVSAEDAAKNEAIPDFAPNPQVGWVLDRAVGPDDLLAAPGGGPGPVTFDRAHPYVPNGRANGHSAWPI